jgi:hypothetical protein
LRVDLYPIRLLAGETFQLLPILALELPPRCRHRFHPLLHLRPRPPLGISAMDLSEVPPAAGQVLRPQMAAPATSVAPLGSTVLKKRKRTGMHLVTSAAAVVVPPAPPAPSVACRHLGSSLCRRPEHGLRHRGILPWLRSRMSLTRRSSMTLPRPTCSTICPIGMQ